MKRENKALIVICTVFILLFGSLIFILPQKDFSENENRYLNKAPRASVNSILSGEYAKDLSSFYRDQFPMRETATSLYAISERALGKRTVGKVIVDRERLISIPDSKAKEASIPFPSITVESKYSLFKKNSAALSLYYKTDHHRTTEGAYALYIEACQALGIKAYPEDFFNKQTVTTEFYGTDFSKSCLPRTLVSPDSIELWRYEGDDEITFTIHDTQKSLQGLYDTSKLETNDNYAIFLGGNYALASVYSSPDKPTLLLFKDSYANSVVPFLALHFNIDLVDPRYATKTQISKAYNDTKYDYRLFLGCLDSFN